MQDDGQGKQRDDHSDSERHLQPLLLQVRPLLHHVNRAAGAESTGAGAAGWERPIEGCRAPR